MEIGPGAVVSRKEVPRHGAKFVFVLPLRGFAPGSVESEPGR